MHDHDDDRALEVGRLVLRLAALLGVSAPAAPAVYTSASLPPDVASPDAFKRVHRAKMRASVAGWSKQGRVRSVTREAWALHVEQETTGARRRPKRIAPSMQATAANDLEGQLVAELGLRRRTGTR